MPYDIRWVFFDLGNTLIDEGQAIQDRIRQMVRAMAERGIRATPETVEKAFERASARFAVRLVAHVVEQFASTPVDQAFVLQKARYRKELEEPYPEARALLAALAPHYCIGVIANQSAGTEARLGSYGLAPFISFCLSSSEVGLAKPDPEFFWLALGQAQCDPAQAIMVGDRLDNDIRPAKLLGCRTIRVLQGFARAQTPRDAHDEPDYTVRNLSEIAALLLPRPHSPPELQGGTRGSEQRQQTR
jgi:HAD superfamily hydrolase (TIGR01549 family)